MDGHPNVEHLRSFLDAYAAHDRAGLSTCLAEDAVWHVGGKHSLSGDYRGREAILGYFDRVGAETAGTLTLEPVEVVANDLRGAAFLRVTADRDGRHLDVTMAEAFVFATDGTITEFWAHSNDQDAVDGFWGEESTR